MAVVTSTIAQKGAERWKKFRSGVADFYGFARSLKDSLDSLSHIKARPIMSTMLNQVKFTGIDALPSLLFTALLVGGTVIIQARTNLPRFGIEGYLGNILVIIIARELGPLVTAIIVVSRSGSAMAVEIATQKWSREIMALSIIGIDARLFIVIPRIFASILSIFSLIVFFDLIAFLGGYFISLTTLYSPMDVFFYNLAMAFTWNDFFSMLLKSILFGILIPVISAYYGFKPESKFQIPIFVSRAVSRTLFAIIVFNALMSIVFYF